MTVGVGILILWVAISLVITASQIGKPRTPTTPGTVALGFIIWFLIILAVIFL